MKRRDFIRNTGLGLLSTSFISNCSNPFNIFSAPIVNKSDNTNPDNAFSKRLVIPTLLSPSADSNGVKQYNINLSLVSHSFFSNKATQVYGINNQYLGPTLLMKSGDKISLNVTNQLAFTTTMHSHGMHLPAIMDGGPHQPIAPNETWSSHYTVNQSACMNWYHPHLMGKTAEHVYNGLAGLIQIEDNETSNLDLPRNYGVDDIPLVIQDKSFNSDNSLKYTPNNEDRMRGWRGDTFMINGVISPFVEVSAKHIRLRFLNASNARSYTFSFKEQITQSDILFQQIGTDNSLLAAPVTLSNLTLSPAERGDVLIDLTQFNNKTIELIDKKTGQILMILKVNQAVSSQHIIPTALKQLNHFNTQDAVTTRTFILDGGKGSLTINGASMDLNRINETVPLNNIEIWKVENKMGMLHNFHIHATYFELIERNGSATNVAENEKGYKDTVTVPPYETVTLITKMTDYSDSTGKYMYHCHILEHEDLGMMGQFVVV